MDEPRDADSKPREADSKRPCHRDDDGQYGVWSVEAGTAAFYEELARVHRELRYAVPREYLVPWEDLTAGQKLALETAYMRVVLPKLSAEYVAGVDATVMTLEYHRDVLKTENAGEMIGDIAASHDGGGWIFNKRPGAREWRLARRKVPMTLGRP